MRVLLLGAGASKSYGASPTGQRMPIAHDFFPIFYKLAIAENPWVLRTGLNNYLMSERNIRNPDEYLNKGIDIEEIHSEIAKKLKNVEQDKNSIDRVVYSKSYNELLFLFSSCLNEISNGPVSQSHLDLANFLNADDIIVTFNWDTLMERALLEGGQWRVEDGYGVEPYSIFRDGWQVPEFPGATPSTKIIKLHGSTNWLTAHPIYEGDSLVSTHDLPIDSLFVFEHATKPYSTFSGRYMSNYAPLTYGYYPPNLTNVPGRPAPEGHLILRTQAKLPWMPNGQADDKGLTSIPLIIPPVREKNYDMFDGLFERIWGQARSAIESCDEIIVIGYSFPPTDLRSHSLFSDAFMKRNSMPRVTIIDPNPDRPVEKFRRDLGISDTHLRVINGPFEGENTLRAL